MADIGVQPHIIEAVLNHQSGHKAGIAGIYNRSSYAEEKAEALAEWDEHVRGRSLTMYRRSCGDDLVELAAAFVAASQQSDAAADRHVDLSTPCP